MVSQFKGKVPKQLIVAKPKKSKAKKAGKISKPLKNSILKVIHNTQETKFVTKEYGPSPFNGIISSKAEWMYPLPSVDMAGNTILASNNTRVGDTIQPRLLRVYATVSLGLDVVRSTDIIVKFYVFNMKAAKSDLAVSSTSTPDAGQFLDGGASNQYFDGVITTLGLPVNTRVFTPIHTYQFRLSKGCGYINGGGYADTYVDGSSTTFKHWSFDIPCPANLKYGDDAAVQPQNFCPIMAVGYVHADGTAPDAAFQDIRVSYRANLFFKDS